MSSSAPSTATVLEFRCLFTHDLRRKQKRWQDGRLKYHSFNARVMVYDERGNSIGDMHWHGEYDFGEGEEVQLDRGGVIVQVEELVERRETDLTELVDKRIQEKQQRQIQQLARSAASSAVLPRTLHRPPAIAPDRIQPARHRPLHRVIGTPTGHHGKAVVPKDSPYEQRQQAADSPDDRSAKRRKYDDYPPSKSGYASALFGQPLTLSATPSSSVPAIRRPRPEARSDPPAEADTQDAREDPKPTRREQLKSSRRLNQSGYAQSLFGQTLTLSHTPVSSVPSRPQPRIEPASSPMVDSDRQDPRETARTAPPQQPIESLHHGQPGGRSRSAMLNTGSGMGNGPAKGSADIGIAEQNDTVSRKVHTRNSVHTVPNNVDIIEIDDPEPVASPPVRQSKAHKTSSASLPSREVNIDRSEVSMGQDHMSHGDSVLSRGQQKLSPGRGDEPKNTKSHQRTKKPETAASKTNSGNSSSGRMDPASHEKIARVATVTKDPAMAVTELRIKSSRKRGLLMISDTSKAKKTRRPVAADSARSSEEASRHHSTGSDDDYLCNPDLNRDGEWESGETTNELGKKCAQRVISTELGEDDDDPFRSPSPAISEQTHVRPKPTTRYSDTQLEESAEPVKITPRSTSDAVEPKKRLAPPRGARYDPYQIPSSPQASNPENPSPEQRDRRVNGVGDEILKPIDNNKKLSKAKKQKHSRRKVVSDVGDEDETEPLAPLPKKTDFGPGPEHVAASRLTEEDPKKQSKSSKATSMKTSAQEGLSWVESDDEMPKRAAQRSRGQQQRLAEGSDEDELPTKRRQSTRQRRSRAVSREEPSAPSSEQDGTEEEEIPRKRRKTKTFKASEDRPRLEKIKKNVKSRELVGFNLAALNAPLGLRGIGMPFSILPSPVNESVQRRASSHAAEDETESTVLVAEGDDQMLPSGSKPPAAPFKMNAEAQRKSPAAMSNKEAPGHVTIAPSEHNFTKTRSPDENLPGELDRFDGPGNPRLSEDHASKKQDAEAANSSSSPRPGKAQALGQDASPPKEKTTSRQRPAPSESRLDAQIHHAAAPAPLENATKVSSAHPLPSLNQPVQDASTTLHRQSSTVLNHTTCEDTADPRADALSKPQVALSLHQQKPGIRVQPPTLEPAHVPNAVETNQAVPSHGSIAPSFMGKSTSTLNRHSSAIVDQNTLEVEKTVERPDSVTTSDVPVRQSKVIGLRRQVSAPRRINNIAAKIAPQAETTEAQSGDVHTKPASNARLANPASRGRKAALASDAAGQIPQRILPPTQPTLMVPVSTADLAMTPIEQAPKEPERPKKKMTFPGFQSARSDGPWSREAFDLLESGRPE